MLITKSDLSLTWGHPMLYILFTILLSSLFFVVSLHTQKQTYQPWPIAIIIPLSPVIAQAALSFVPSPSPSPLLPPSNACFPLCHRPCPCPLCCHYYPSCHLSSCVSLSPSSLLLLLSTLPSLLPLPSLLLLLPSLSPLPSLLPPLPSSLPSHCSCRPCHCPYC
jgi:hypothetical protein